MRVRQPGVEREHRDLDREGQEERQEGEQLEALAEADPSPRTRAAYSKSNAPVHDPVVEARRVGRGQDRHQHQQRPDQGVQDELDRGVDPVRAAPDPDDQVHRDEDDLPEDVEQEQVEGHEHADQPDLEDEERDHVLLDPLLDRAEGGEDADPGQGRRQDDEDRRQAVDADLVLDPEDGDPVDVSTSEKPGRVGSNWTSITSDSPKATRAVARAAIPDRPSAVRGMNAMTIAPTSGVKMISAQPAGDSTDRSSAYRLTITEVGAGHDDQPDGDAERVVLDPAGLDPAETAAEADEDRADLVDGPVDDRPVEPPGRPPRPVRRSG